MSILYLRERAEVPEQLPKALLYEVQGALNGAPSSRKIVVSKKDFLRLIDELETNISTYVTTFNPLLPIDSLQKYDACLSALSIINDEQRKYHDRIKCIKGSISLPKQVVTPKASVPVYAANELLPKNLLEEVRESLNSPQPASSETQPEQDLDKLIESLDMNIWLLTTGITFALMTQKSVTEGELRTRQKEVLDLIERAKNIDVQYVSILRSIAETNFSGLGGDAQ